MSGTESPPAAPASHAASDVRRSAAPSAAALAIFLRAPGTGAVVATGVTFAVFAFWAQSFVTYLAATSYMLIAAQLGIIAVGASMLMMAGEFDLSVGSVFGLSQAVIPPMLNHGVPPSVAVVVGLLVAGLVGFINGLIVTRTQLSSFIVTLASLNICRGIVLIITKGFAETLTPNATDSDSFRFLNLAWNSMNITVAWFAGLVAIGAFVLLRTEFGQWVYATGGNAIAARKSGIPTSTVKMRLFVLTSLCAGLAGILELANFNSVDPLSGQGYELTVIAAVVIGGTSLRGGVGSVVGAGFGVITFGMIQVGLQLANVSVYYFQALVGVVLLAAMILQLYTSKFAIALRAREIKAFEERAEARGASSPAPAESGATRHP